MNQPYFIVVLAHSLHGRLRRVHIPYQVVYAVLALALFGFISLAGLAASYLRMSWKVANYNSLRHELEVLRNRYSSLEKETKQQNVQLASLKLIANEVSLAYGLKKRLEGPADIRHEGRLIPTISETLEQYNFLRSAKFSLYARRSTPLFQTPSVPGLWPVEGRLMSHFGNRTDPFSGEGAFHAGVDISAPKGTPVKATGDGLVVHAAWGGQYGKLVVVEHGNGFQTYYAHMSQIEVVEGQTVRRGDLVGLTGSTGRSTSPHLHYEVRRGGTAINPHPYLNGRLLTPVAKTEYF